MLWAVMQDGALFLSRLLADEGLSFQHLPGAAGAPGLALGLVLSSSVGSGIRWLDQPPLGLVRSLSVLGGLGH